MYKRQIQQFPNICSSETCPEGQEVEVTLFEQVKGCVTARQAAEHYGIKVKGNGMACCPFHKDRHPSMKADKIYHCFACGAVSYTHLDVYKRQP